MPTFVVQSELSDALAKLRRFYSENAGAGLDLSPTVVGAMASTLKTMELIALNLESEAARLRLHEAARVERTRHTRSLIAAGVRSGAIALLPIVPRPTAGGAA